MLRIHIYYVDLVGSTLSDPYISYSAALFALAGPLHGLANQEVLRWQLAMQEKIGPGNEVTHDQIKEYLWATLKSGQVVPGYGHGVLRNPDPRFVALQEFCDAHPELGESPVVQLVKKVGLNICIYKFHSVKVLFSDIRGCSGCLEGAWQDQEPIPQCRCYFRLCTVSLWPH